MSFYSVHAQEYIEETMGTDMSEMYSMFLTHVRSGGRILDVGFGSGRDMLQFSRLGYQVKGIDAELAFVAHAKALGLDAICADLLDYQPEERFDGIWACASLLHLKKADLPRATRHLRSLLTKEGTLFIAMKKGIGEGVDERGRWMAYVTEEEINAFNPFELRLYNEERRGIPWLHALFNNK